MMANTSINLTTLDFDELKANFVNYMQNRPEFANIDYSGTNISALVDLLTYNTYLNSFYLNMVASEMFLDSAQFRESVVSHAKALNYVPRSFRSAEALVNISITPTTTVPQVTIPRGTEFLSRVGSNTFTFTTEQNITLLSNTNVFTVTGVPIYEGSFIDDTFVMDTSNTEQRFVLSNPNIDTRSLEVIVSENSEANIYFYEVRTSLFDVSSNTAMCFLQAAENDQYEIVFGNGISGRPPSDGALIYTRYRVSAGELPNGASVFTPAGSIDGHANVVVSTQSSARDGEVYETIESIKFNAPRFYQTQERAVTAQDYQVLLQTTFPEITAINVYGGEDAEPPRYGTVVIALSVAGALQVPDYKKQEYSDYIRRRTSLSSDPVFIEPDYLNLDLDIIVKYNTGSTTQSTLDIETSVRSAIQSFNDVSLNDFETTMYHSSLVQAIKDADDSIISVDLRAKPIINFVPTINESVTYTFSFLNPFRRLPHSDRVHIYEDEHTLRSTPFTINGTLCTLEDDGDGNVRTVQVSGTNHLVVDPKAGTINYDAGIITLQNFNPSGYQGTGISLYALTLDRDITASRNQIIRILPNDVGISVLSERIL